MQSLGHFARVSIEAVKYILERAPGALNCALGVSEIHVSSLCRNPKRRAEFVAGRIAAKLAFLAGFCGGESACVLASRLDIPPAVGSLPILYEAGYPVGAVSISHSGRWAVAFFPFSGRGAVDVEDDLWKGRMIQEYFSGLELAQITDHSEARYRWVVKECCFKLAGNPRFDVFENLLTIAVGSQRFVGIVAYPESFSPLLLGTWTWGSLAAGFGLQLDRCNIRKAVPV